MQLFYTDHFELPLPEGHRFPMSKYRLLRQRIAAASWATQCELRVPDAATNEQLKLVHTSDYVDRVANGALTAREVRRIGFPWSPALVERSRRSTGATIAAARAALTSHVSVNLAGGTHHAFADRGEGFCVFNDVAVAVRVLQAEAAIETALIVDCDVHQGNGTADVFAEDPSVTTFSIHGKRNYPLTKTRSDLDVALPDGSGDEPYLALLDDALRQLFDACFPDAVFYLAGADPYRDDRLGRLQLTKAGLAERDRMVLGRCRERDVPAAVVMAGGYAEQVADIVDIHEATVRAAWESIK